jgi:hypothetical protein
MDIEIYTEMGPDMGTDIDTDMDITRMSGMERTRMPGIDLDINGQACSLFSPFNPSVNE